MALGLIPVYNHACPSNCEYFQDYEEGIIYIKTVKAIQAGDELFINYNGDFDNEKPVWFPVSE
jgi:SET domain-containing protein